MRQLSVSFFRRSPTGWPSLDEPAFLRPFHDVHEANRFFSFLSPAKYSATVSSPVLHKNSWLAPFFLCHNLNDMGWTENFSCLPSPFFWAYLPFSWAYYRFLFLSFSCTIRWSPFSVLFYILPSFFFLLPTAVLPYAMTWPLFLPSFSPPVIGVRNEGRGHFFSLLLPSMWHLYTLSFPFSLKSSGFPRLTC